MLIANPAAMFKTVPGVIVSCRMFIVAEFQRFSMRKNMRRSIYYIFYGYENSHACRIRIPLTAADHFPLYRLLLSHPVKANIYFPVKDQHTL